jgi:hypothetical protein
VKINGLAQRCAALFLSLTLATSQVVHAQGSLTQMPVTPEFTELEINWQGSEGKGYLYRMRIFDIKGVLVLCGAGAYLKASNRSQTKTILKRATLKMNDRAILKDFTYFTQLDRAEALGQAQANCRSTGVATPKGDVTFDIDYGTRGVRF